MTRYRSASGPEGEYEPGSHGRVLRNLLGIKLKSQMDELEALELQSVQEQYYSEGLVTVDTQFTARLIREMHEDWLGEI